MTFFINEMRGLLRKFHEVPGSPPAGAMACGFGSTSKAREIEKMYKKAASSTVKQCAARLYANPDGD